MVEPFPGPGAPADSAAGPPLPPAPPPPSPPPPPRTRVALVLGILGAALVVILAVSIPLVMGVWDERTGSASESAVNLDEVHQFGGLSADHTLDDVDYGHEPPAGGPHDPAWLSCGVYDEPVRDENLVHSLEHGTVWITYTEDVSGDDVDELADVLPDEGILSPYPGQDAPVVITVWARQLELDGADDPRLELFLTEYGDGHTAPEPMASCVGGVRETGDGGVSV